MGLEILLQPFLENTVCYRYIMAFAWNPLSFIVLYEAQCTLQCSVQTLLTSAVSHVYIYIDKYIFIALYTIPFYTIPKYIFSSLYNDLLVDI